MEFFSSDYQRYGIMGANYGLAVEFYLDPMLIHIIGSKKEKSIFHFLKESLRAYNPLKTVEVIDPVLDKNRLRDLGYPITNVPIAYVCSEGTCKSVESPKNIVGIIKSETNTN